MDIKKAKEFIYRNARPIELALWNYYMEQGSIDDVLHNLSFYQNEDGGFGHALEPDSFNPNSAPIETWQATKILQQVGYGDSSHPIIQGILRYLGSGEAFLEETGQWKGSVPENNNYPHAIWWSYEPDKEGEYSPNPSAALAGFILCYAFEGSELWQKGKTLAQKSYQWLVENYPIQEEHMLECYIQLYHYLREAEITDVIDMNDFKRCLIELVSCHICYEAERWGKEYVPRPSRFIHGKQSIFYKGNEEIVKQECEYLAKAQLEDGSFAVPWEWYSDYKEFELAKNWWKAIMILENVVFWEEFHLC